jgi:crotonobetaine/carnitine-CoA ligase
VTSVAPYPLPDPDEIFPRLVARMAATQPDRTFVHSIGEGSFTWAELDRAARDWAARYATIGIGPGSTVATLTPNGLRSLASWLGLTWLGAVEVSVNTEYRGRMLAYALNRCEASTLLVAERHLDQLEEVAGKLRSVRQVVVVDQSQPRLTGLPFAVLTADGLSAGSPPPELIEPQWHDIACVMYTSGTTGPSKPVRIPWGQLHALNLGTHPAGSLGPDDVLYGLSPSYHIGAKQLPYLTALFRGQVLLRDRFSGTEFWDDVERYGITTAGMVGTMAEYMYRSPDGPGPETTLHNVFMVPIIPDFEKFNARFGTRVITMYNSTELSLPICHSTWDPPNRRAAGRLREGYPGFEVRLVDDFDREVPDGQVGELIVRASVPWTLNAGYLNMPEETADAWRNGWFHTGDGLIRTPEGHYIFVDRMKDAIRRRGENISSFEVEADVMSHPDIRECAAVATPAETGEDEILVFAVPKPGSELTPEGLARWLEPRMARHMVPRYIEFIEALPRTVATMKVQKVELRKRGTGPATWDRTARAED